MMRQAAVARFDALLAESGDRLAREDFDGAERKVQAALGRLDRDDRSLYSEEDYAQRRALAVGLLDDIVRQRETWDQGRLAAEASEKDLDRATRERDESSKRDRLIIANLRHVNQLQQEQKYAEALDVISEILFIDEHNPAALALRDALRATQLYRQFTGYQRSRQFGYAEQDVQNEGAMQPPTVNLRGPGDRSTNALVTYPEDWEDLTNRRFGVVDGYRDSVENRLGEENQGWQVTVSALAHERSSISEVVGLTRTLEAVRELANRCTKNGRPAARDPHVRRRLAQFDTRIEAMRLNGLRFLTKQLKGDPVGSETSVNKLLRAQLEIEMGELALEIEGGLSVLGNGDEDSPEDGRWQRMSLSWPEVVIGGGTPNIQKNIIAERVLGLPKD